MGKKKIKNKRKIKRKISKRSTNLNPKKKKNKIRRSRTGYMVGLVPPDHFGDVDSVKEIYRKSKTKTLADARRKGKTLLHKERKNDIEGSEIVILKKRKSGKYKEHSFYNPGSQGNDWEKVK